jgi:hypothetical protein
MGTTVGRYLQLRDEWLAQQRHPACAGCFLLRVVLS